MLRGDVRLDAERVVHTSTQPPRLREHFRLRALQAQVRIAPDQPYPSQSRLNERAEELGPEHILLAGTHRVPKTSRGPVSDSPMAITNARLTIPWS